MAKGECSTPSSLLSGLGQMAGPPFFPPLGIRRAGLQEKAGLLGLSPRMRCRTSHRSRLAQEDPTSCKSHYTRRADLDEAVVAVGPACRPDAAVGVALGGGLMI